MTWSVNELAARAIALHAATPAEARHLLEMCGLLDGDRIAPDDLRRYDLNPIVAKQETHEPALTRRDKGVRAPAGLRGGRHADEQGDMQRVRAHTDSCVTTKKTGRATAANSRTPGPDPRIALGGSDAL